MIAEDFGPVYTRAQKTREGTASAVCNRHDRWYRGQLLETMSSFDAEKRPGEYPCCQIDRLRGCQGKRRGLPRHEGRRVKAAKAVDAGTLRGSPCQAASRLLHFVPALRVTRRAPQRRGR